MRRYAGAWTAEANTSYVNLLGMQRNPVDMDTVVSNATGPGNDRYLLMDELLSTGDTNHACVLASNLDISEAAAAAAAAAAATAATAANLVVVRRQGWEVTPIQSNIVTLLPSNITS
jgi:hypothetical protein